MTEFPTAHPTTPSIGIRKLSQHLGARNEVMGLVSDRTQGRSVLFGDRSWTVSRGHQKENELIATGIAKIMHGTIATEELLPDALALGACLIIGTETERGRTLPATHLFVIAQDAPSLIYVDTESIVDVLVSETNMALRGLGSPYELPLVLPGEMIN